MPFCWSGPEPGGGVRPAPHQNFSTVIRLLSSFPRTECRNHRLSVDTDKPHAVSPWTFATVATCRVAKWKRRTEGFFQPEKK